VGGGHFWGPGVGAGLTEGLGVLWVCKTPEGGVSKRGAEGFVEVVGGCCCCCCCCVREQCEIYDADIR
jgi:hypothetical protein